MSDKELLGDYKLVLGLEIHLHVKTEFKMFSRGSANIYDSPPNTHVSPVDLGLPGALPVPNFEAVKKTQLFGLALNSSIRKNSKFDRKHYTYPDLPKGYQLSQYKEPLCEGGYLKLDSGFVAEITRIHLEEDTARSYHEKGRTLIDFNKSGMPLMELVTDPVFRTVADASEFARKIREIARFLNVSDADMEKGQMRIEPNISLRTAKMEQENTLPAYKVEVKNINSFKFMEKAICAEIIRQRSLLEKGAPVPQENRGYNELTNKTVSQRTKEDAHDYRYFPEPDIPPMVFDDDYIDELRASMPELPAETKARLLSQYGLSEQSATELTRAENSDLLKQFENLAVNNIDPIEAANLLLNKVDYRNISVEEFKAKLTDSKTTLDDKSELTKMVKNAIKDNPKAVEDYRKGKDTALKFLLGYVMRQTGGKANVQTVEQLLVSNLVSAS